MVMDKPPVAVNRQGNPGTDSERMNAGLRAGVAPMRRSTAARRPRRGRARPAIDRNSVRALKY